MSSLREQRPLMSLTSGTAFGRVYRKALELRVRSCTPVPLRESAIVFAPHQDDDTLRCGGTLIKKRQSGADVCIVYLTDGSGSHPGLIEPSRMKSLRAQEAVAAAAVMGIGPSDIHFLDFPDGELTRHRNAARDRVIQILTDRHPQQVFVPYRSDVHEDHIVTSEIVRSAFTRCRGGTISVYEYPIWFWCSWPMVRPVRALKLSVDSPNLVRWLRLTLLSSLRTFVDFRSATYIGDVLTRKRDALSRHQSQLTRLDDDPRWRTLGDAAGGQFIDLFFQKYELFRHSVVAPG